MFPISFIISISVRKSPEQISFTMPLGFYSQAIVFFALQKKGDYKRLGLFVFSSREKSEEKMFCMNNFVKISLFVIWKSSAVIFSA